MVSIAGEDAGERRSSDAVINSRSFPSDYSYGRTISWSKNGFIAYAAPTTSKYRLYLTYMENIDGSSWKLAEPQGIPIRQLEDTHSAEISMVSWSNLSTDLAVSDIHGNFYIFLAGVGVLEHRDKNGQSPKLNGSGNGSGNANGTGNGTGNGSGNGTGNGTGPGESGAKSPNYELTSYNHLEMIYRHTVDPTCGSKFASLSQIVTLKWLKNSKPVILNKQATIKYLEGNNQQSSPFAYSYGVSQHEQLGVSHPIPTKQACVSVRRNGEFTLYFQGEHRVEYYSISKKLEFSSENVYIITAGVGFERDKSIIVTAYDKVSHRIRTFIIKVDWGYLAQSAQKQRLDPHYHTPADEQKSPSLEVCIADEIKPLPSFIYSPSSSGSNPEDQMIIDDEPKDDKPKDYMVQQLSAINIISPNFDKQSRLDILIGYECRDLASETTTCFYRYNLTEASDVICDVFSELEAKKSDSVSNKVSGIPDYTLLLQDKITRRGQIQRVDTSFGDQFIVLVHTDAKFDVIDRKTMVVVTEPTETSTSKSGPPTTISSLFNVGFKFPQIKYSGNPILSCVSPNLTSVVYTEVNSSTHQLSVRTLERESSRSISPKDLFISSVGIAFTHSYACYTNTCEDDIIALVQSELNHIHSRLKNSMPDLPQNIELILNKFIESVICESHKAINFQLDAFGRESVDKLLSNSPLQKLLSLQLILGELVFAKRVISDISWIILNLRSTSFGIMFLLSSMYRQISKKKPTEDTLQDSITRGECIMSLIGGVKWLIDLMVYLSQELLQLSHNESSPNTGTLNYSNSVVIPLLLSKIPRFFLIYALSSIGKTNEILKKISKDISESNKAYSPMKQALNRYFTICNASPLNLGLFEAFLKDCDAHIQREFSQIFSSSEKGHSLKVEQKLICHGEVIEELVPIAKSVVAKHSRSVSRDIKVSDVYFYDVDWLDVGVRKSNNAGNTKDSPLASIIHNYPSPATPIRVRSYLGYGKFIDGLRKIIIDAKDNHTSDGSKNGPKFRRCIRCRSVSLTNDPLVFEALRTIGLWTMVFQRTCICGSAWVNIDSLTDESS